MRITIIGSGNVGTHLAAAFKNAGHVIVQIYSPHMHNAELLAYHIKAQAIGNLNDINPETDVFIISVKDDAIAGIAEALAKHNKVMAHTSGSVDLSVLSAFSDMSGVFYPLQTFSKNKAVDFLKVPLCIEGANAEVTGELVKLAQTISNNVQKIDSAQRKVLHMAAVFAGNFPNFLYGVAQQLLEKHNLQFDLLRPLILETAMKVQKHLPDEAQTGPAVRNDEKTIALHQQMLADDPALKALYGQISQDIIKNFNAKHGLK
jgi:predicted short-subunit dehydrogenase-like oxidoreductase (DUF2520 family)